MRQRIWMAGLAGLFGLTVLTAHSAHRGHAQERERRTAEDAIDPRAEAVVRRMSDHLNAVRRFEVTADHTTEVVLESGQKLQMLATSTLQLERPNRLRSERRGPLAHVTLYYDGDTITIHGQRKNVYAQADAPDALDAALDFARDRLNADAPAADLLYTDSYEGLMEGVTSGMYVGRAEIDGVDCDHVAFVGEEVDFQLWVERGEHPLPRRYVIVSKDQPSAPEFTVELRDWNLEPTFTAGFFSFEPPPGTQRIEFLDAVTAEQLARGGEAREEGAGT